MNSYADGSVTLVTLKVALLSHDGGKTWSPLQLPEYAKGLYNLTIMPDSSLWLAAREGAMESVDGGRTWRYAVGGIPNKDVLAVRYDEAGQRLLATALHEHEIFESTDKGQTWRRIGLCGCSHRTGYQLPRTSACHLQSQWSAAAGQRCSDERAGEGLCHVWHAKEQSLEMWSNFSTAGESNLTGRFSCSLGIVILRRASADEGDAVPLLQRQVGKPQILRLRSSATPPHSAQDDNF